MGANWHLEKWWNTNWALMFWKMKQNYNLEKKHGTEILLLL